ncbi:MAG: PilW family protein [Candidatus Heimdallarchaeota archaeon]
MKNILKSNKGISLIEIIVTLPLATLIFVGVSLSLIHFISTYQETKLYTQLQEDLFTAVETMRQGYAIDEFTKNQALIGLCAANYVEINNANNEITVSPALAEDNTNISNYWSKFSCDDEGQLWVFSSHGLSKTFKRPIKIFPSTPTNLIGNQPQFRILNKNSIWEIQKRDGKGNPVLMRITLEAQVRFRAKQIRQTQEDDLQQNTKTIKYETSVFIGNSQT